MNIKTNLFKYKERYYVVIDSMESKCKESGEWHSAIVYMDINSGDKYVRDAKDFVGKFSMCEIE